MKNYIAILATCITLTAYSCPLPEARTADVNKDGVVDVLDMNLVLGNWGGVEFEWVQCNPFNPELQFCPVETPSDINYDEVVDMDDLLIVFGNWG